MLDPLVIRILSGLGVLGVLAGLALFRAKRSPLDGGVGDVRAHRPVPRPLEILWVAVVNIPLAALFAAAAWPDLLYSPPLSLRFANDSVVQVAGFAILTTGGILSLVAIGHLGKYMALQIAVSRDHRLVTTGPYARIRHPLYTSVMLTSLGASLLYLQAVLFVDFLLVVVIARYRARIEETLLSSPQAFGAEYTAYIGRTGRFLPRLGAR